MIFKRNKPAPRQEVAAIEPVVAETATEPSYIGRDTTVEGNISTAGEIQRGAEKPVRHVCRDVAGGRAG